MGQLEDKYISLLTDFGFKRIFGTAPNKDLLISFLNTLFDGEEVVADVQYLNGEKVGDTYSERKAIFDVYCENEKGEKFIVEMQNAYQIYFKDRAIYYSTFANAHLFSARQSKASFDCSRLSKNFPIREQAERGDWDYQLKHVYVVALLNFDMHESAFDESRMEHTAQLCDVDTGRVFYKKLTFKYVELPKFHKTEDELVTMRDKWYFVLRNLQRLQRQPEALQERVFQRLFEQASIARFEPTEREDYERSIGAYRDIKNSVNTAKAEGRMEGRLEGRKEGRLEGRKEGRDERSVEIARAMLAMNMTVEQVVRATGLSDDVVRNL